MNLLDKRLNDHGKNWRHVFKSLIVLDYCLRCGSENVVRYSRENLHIITTLKEFQYVNNRGVDRGSCVREKSKEVAALLNNDVLLQEERAKKASGFRQYNHDSNWNSNLRNYSTSFHGSEFEREDLELQLAMEESRVTAEEHAVAQAKKEQEFLSRVNTVEAISLVDSVPESANEEDVLVDFFDTPANDPLQIQAPYDIPQIDNMSHMDALSQLQQPMMSNPVGVNPFTGQQRQIAPSSNFLENAKGANSNPFAILSAVNPSTGSLHAGPIPIPESNQSFQPFHFDSQIDSQYNQHHLQPQQNQVASDPFAELAAEKLKTENFEFRSSNPFNTVNDDSVFEPKPKFDWKKKGNAMPQKSLKELETETRKVNPFI